MASVKPRGGRFELTVKRKAIRDKPWYFTFDTEDEATEYGRKLEALLDAGIVPPELVDTVKRFSVVGDVIREYLLSRHVAEGDADNLRVLSNRIGGIALGVINYKWAESWVASMKRVDNISPSTIRHYSGALARCFDWAVTQGIAELVPNPLRLLPKGYATYTPGDRAEIAKLVGKVVKFDVSRVRRLEPGEECNIRAIMDRQKFAGKERAFLLKWQAAIECIFDLAVETAMRLSEIAALQLPRIDLDNATIFLEKTKNGKKRQVPLTTVAIAVLNKYIGHVLNGERGMDGFDFGGDGYLFPWYADKALKGHSEGYRAARVRGQLSQQFGRVFDAAGCKTLTFHDLRHEATSRFFERTELSDFEIMKITGHSSTKMLARYANLRGSNLAKKMWGFVFAFISASALCFPNQALLHIASI